MLDEFKKGPPGRRFQRHHRRRRGRSGGRLWRYLVFAAGGLLCALGLFFMAVPGPGIPILLAGAALIAGESLGMARLLDRTELRLRRFLRSRARG